MTASSSASERWDRPTIHSSSGLFHAVDRPRTCYLLLPRNGISTIHSTGSSVRYKAEEECRKGIRACFTSGEGPNISNLFLPSTWVSCDIRRPLMGYKLLPKVAKHYCRSFVRENVQRESWGKDMLIFVPLSRK